MAETEEREGLVEKKEAIQKRHEIYDSATYFHNEKVRILGNNFGV
jgi:hypothetical protein